MFWNKLISNVLGLNDFKVVILRTEIPVVWKWFQTVCGRNKYYDWKYLLILVRNDLTLREGNICMLSIWYVP